MFRVRLEWRNARVSCTSGEAAMAIDGKQKRAAEILPRFFSSGGPSIHRPLLVKTRFTLSPCHRTGPEAIDPIKMHSEWNNPEEKVKG